MSGATIHEFALMIARYGMQESLKLSPTNPIQRIFFFSLNTPTKSRTLCSKYTDIFSTCNVQPHPKVIQAQ
ncbi:hypothetical protein ACRALDRAFT_1061610 [Sodiomyces alcalophilus JCM 7366]|uniref:uncharacterized protein n=1 Tax=Sodiomyces alcalophilus JCM 7366 TaxID=591952 RepID=UPI0039B6B5A8